MIFLSRFVIQTFLVLLIAAGTLAAQPLGVAVSIAPLEFFTKEIGGERVQVLSLVGEGSDPHTYEPRPQQMRELAKMNLLVTIGIEFEEIWLERIQKAAPQLVIIDGAAGIERIPMQEPLEVASHTHSHKHSHNHDDFDPHIWLSPANALTITETIMTALTQADPAGEAFYRERSAALRARIEALNADLQTAFAPHQGRDFLVFHPSWGYFARDFGLTQLAIEIEGKEPKPAQLAQVIAHAREKNVSMIFVQPQFSQRSAQTVAKELGARIVLANPLAADWLNNLQHVANSLQDGIAR